MARVWFARVFVASLLVVHAFSVAVAQPPPQFESIERYAAMVNDGAKAPMRLMFSRGVSYAELALSWSEEHGTAALPRLYSLIDAGLRLEVAFHAAVGDGVIITTERMWVVDAPEALTPLQATGVYVLDGDRILSITRVLDVDQRHALMHAALVGTWQETWGQLRFAFDAEGTLRYGPLVGAPEGDVTDGGTYVVEADLLTWVRDETTQICAPDDVTVLQVRFLAPDSLAISAVDDTCRGWVGKGSLRLDRVVD